MFKTLLVAVDGSNHSLKALDLAVELAQLHGARLLILNVYKPISALESQHTLVKSMPELQASATALKDLGYEVIEAALAHVRAKGITDVEGVVKRGQPARVIVEFAKEQAVDAIVIGSRGLGDVGKFLLGSVSHKVSSLARCTCITVK